ncbi:MAG: hypothetical protein A2V86_04440 [Deltaproteobacteria bacterium RBG_16_49_23]|nr:MAG: hypothetical protein A2V86_04440 [Deltaproteobacteria bacterium RBG_16_49_23]
MKRQFIEKLSIDLYPGTLNLDILEPESIVAYQNLKAQRGIEIIPEDPSFCSARCYLVLINGLLKAAIVLPLVEGYPDNKMELIAPQNIKEALSVATGDILEVEVIESF